MSDVETDVKTAVPIDFAKAELARLMQSEPVMAPPPPRKLRVWIEGNRVRTQIEGGPPSGPQAPGAALTDCDREIIRLLQGWCAEGRIFTPATTPIERIFAVTVEVVERIGGWTVVRMTETEAHLTRPS